MGPGPPAAPASGNGWFVLRGLGGSERWVRMNARTIPIAAALVAFALYLGLLSDFTFNVVADEGLGLVFNDMLARLLRWDFTIGPNIIGYEALSLHGRTYAYFGIWPAIARAPLATFFDLETQAIGRLTCAMAAAGAVYFTARTLCDIGFARLPRPALLTLIACTLLVGLPFILTRSSSVYNEPVFWSACFVAGFLAALYRPLARGEPIAAASLALMAAMAGLCLNTRASTGLGLCAAATSLTLYIGYGRWRDTHSARAAALAVAPPVTVLALFTIIALGVNFMRWGDPFEFLDLSKQTLLQHGYPGRLVRLETQGLTNPARLWFGLQYYFLPIWALWDSSGRTIFSAWMAHWLDGGELPPASLLLTDAIWIGLAVFGARKLLAPSPDRAPLALALIGFAPPALMILMHIYMALRYRIEFQPIVMALAFYGLLVWSRVPVWSPRVRALLFAGAAISIGFSAITFDWTALPLGPAHLWDLRALLTR